MNKIIYDFSRHNAKNAQHVQFVTDILVAVPEDVATQYGFAAQRSAFATAAEEEIACFKPDKGYELPKFDLKAVREKTHKAIDGSVYLMAHINCPGVLVECGFLSNAEETALLKTEDYQRKLALSITAGYLAGCAAVE